MSKKLELHGKEKIHPVGKRVLIQLNPVEELTTEGGIVLPDLHHEENRIGVILAVGDEVNERFQPGDKILVGWVFGDALHFPGEGITDDTIRMGTQSEIWAKLSEE